MLKIPPLEKWKDIWFSGRGKPQRPGEAEDSHTHSAGLRDIYRQDAKSAKKAKERLQRIDLPLEHGVQHHLGNLIDLLSTLIHCLFPLRSSRLRGEKVNPLP